MEELKNLLLGLKSPEKSLRGKELNSIIPKINDFFENSENIRIVEFPTFMINDETGNLIEPYIKVDCEKTMTVSTYKIEYNPIKKIELSGDFAYLYSISLFDGFNDKNKPTVDFLIRYASFNKNVKKIAAFSIFEKTLNEFDELSQKYSINKSKFVENAMKDFINKMKS